MMRASDPRPHPHRWKECRDRPGDRIEARRNGFTHYFGRVEQAFPEGGTVLIIEGVAGSASCCTAMSTFCTAVTR
jgi:hypothetical protein